MKTCNVSLKPESAFQFLNALDDNGSGYHFTRIGDPSRKPNTLIDLELWVDGSADRMHVVLRPDGTWSATSQLIVGE